MPSQWTTPTELRAQIQALWDKGLLLAELVHGETSFPRRLTVKTPNSAEISAQFEAVRHWAQSLAESPFRIIHREFQHRLFGQNQLPAEAWVDTLDAALALIGKRREAALFAQILRSTAECEPKLLPWLQRRPLKALAHAADWEKLLTVIGWLQTHPRPGIYLRQIDLPGIDSKFVEAHRGLLAELLDLALPPAALDASASGVNGFNRRYGFRDKPERLRCRFLDPLAAPMPLLATADFSLDTASLAELNPAVDRVFITENEVNFLAFPAVDRSMILFGAGYGFSALAALPWLRDKTVHYWGDIDSHGFAILDQLRAVLPQTQSLLMDETTLLACRHFWGQETSPTRHPLSRLTAAENQLYQKLCANDLAPALRLEQERIPLLMLKAALSNLA